MTACGVVRSAASARLPDMPGTLPGISGAYPMHPMGPTGLVASSKLSVTTWWIGGCGRAFRAVHRRRGWFSQHLRRQSSRLAASVARCAIVTARSTISSAAPCIALALPASPAYATWIMQRMYLSVPQLLRPILQPPGALLSPPVLAALLYGHSVALPLDWHHRGSLPRRWGLLPLALRLSWPSVPLLGLQLCLVHSCDGPVVSVAARWPMGSLPLERRAQGAVWHGGVSASTWAFDDSLWDSCRWPVRVLFARLWAPPCTSGAAPSLCALMLPLVTSLSCSPTFETVGLLLRQRIPRHW
ncbi:hypothetical protein BU15DRAFT_67951 [Melanogaster broomeanus]|nr:hypothetical protein BU15DRAFT_67951 [Melanogaster broomeanus]